jgi:acyl carrier protein
VQSNLESAVKLVMADVLDLEATAIQHTTSVNNTPGWDSANHIRLLLALEEEFSISFEVKEFESMLSFSDIIQVMQSKL